MPDTPTPNNSDEQPNSPSNSDSGSSEEQRPKISLSLRKKASGENPPEKDPQSSDSENPEEEPQSSAENESEKTPEEAVPSLSLKKTPPAEENKVTPIPPPEEDVSASPPPVETTPDIEENIEEPIDEEIETDALVPESEEPEPPPEETAKPPPPVAPPKATVQAPPPPPVAPPSAAPPPAPPAKTDSEDPGGQESGATAPKKASNFKILLKLGTGFILVAALLVGAIYLIVSAFTSTETTEETTAEKITPPAPTNPIQKARSVAEKIGGIHMDAESPLSELVDAEEASPPSSSDEEPGPSIIRHTRESTTEDESPVAQVPPEEPELYEAPAPEVPAETIAPEPVVQKPTPDPAVVEFLNSLVVKGVKSKGERPMVLLNTSVFSIDAVVNHDLGIRFIAIDSESRYLVFIDKNGVRYRKPY